MDIVRAVRERLFGAAWPGGHRAASSKADAEAVAAYWDQHVGEHMELFAHWESPPPIAAAMNRYLTGNPALPPASWFLQQYGPFGRVADVGSGDGILAQAILGNNPAVEVDAFDISAASLERGKARATRMQKGAERARFIRIDLNSEPLPENAYDAVMSTGSMHHVRDLDFCFAGMRRALRDGGVLWLNDYVGPDRFQWSDAQMRLADELLALVPKKWRRLDHVARCSAEALAKLDPSEAVAPSAIESTLSAYFEIEKKWARGGTLLAPIFGSGCLAPEMLDDPEGAALLAALYEVELDLTRAGRIATTHAVYIARPLPDAGTLIRRTLAPHLAQPTDDEADAGIRGPIEPWLARNVGGDLQDSVRNGRIAPFPPAELMQRTSGLTEAPDFARHGIDLVRAFSTHLPEPLSTFRKVFDFGVGVGRAARLFKGIRGTYAGVDLDADNIAWVRGNLPWVEARRTEPGKPFPADLTGFDLVISVSVFTHMDRESFAFYAKELARVTTSGGYAALTFSSNRVIDRALGEPAILSLLALPVEQVRLADEALASGDGFYFAEQYTHLTSDAYRYGLTFVSEDFVAKSFAPYFAVEKHVQAAIHDFQDLVILKRR